MGPKSLRAGDVPLGRLRGLRRPVFLCDVCGRLAYRSRSICQRSIGVYWLQGGLIDRPLRSTDARSSSHNRCGSSLSPLPFSSFALTSPAEGSNADPQRVAIGQHSDSLFNDNF